MHLNNFIEWPLNWHTGSLGIELEQCMAIETLGCLVEEYDATLSACMCQSKSQGNLLARTMGNIFHWPKTQLPPNTCLKVLF